MQNKDNPSPARARNSKIIACVSAAILLSACGGGGYGISLENPGFFTSRTNDDTITGRYNSEGFTTAKVRSLLARSCASGRLNSYGEAPVEGLMAFTATCDGATRYSFAGSEYERLDSGKILIETTFTDGAGNLQFATEEVS